MWKPRACLTGLPGTLVLGKQRAKGQGQARLADATRACDRHLAHRSIGQETLQRGQLLLATQKGGGLGWQIVERGRQPEGWRRPVVRPLKGWRDRLIPADGFVEFGGFRRGLDAKLVAQQLATPLVLRQGCRPLAVQGQQAHRLQVGLLAPGVQRHLPPGIPQRKPVFAAPLVALGQTTQRVH